ncbi:MAG: cold shock domain-containing protein [Butyrivibrio sp.]
MTGTVIFYNSERGFGFIRQDENPENIFFHISNCSEQPEANMRVQYAIAEGRKGLEAVNISII